MKIKVWLSALVVGGLSLSLVSSSVWAAEISSQNSGDVAVADESESAVDSASDETFSLGLVDDETAEFRMGANIFLAGNIVNSNKSTQSQLIQGLLFVAGNQLELGNSSEYAFVAGNLINYSGQTSRDLFMAGNSITIVKDAAIGRDAFIAGQTVKFETDLEGDLSVSAQALTLKDVEIQGDVNLDVETVTFDGKVKIAGKLSLNDTADVIGLSNATYDQLEKYTQVDYDLTATEILMSKIFSIAALFVVLVIMIAMFPGLDERIRKELNLAQFGKDLIVGLCTLFFTPVIILFLLISYLGAPAGLILLAVYIITLYLAQGFTGYYLGKAIFEKLLHSKMNKYVEAFVGIAIVLLCTWISPLIWFVAAILGLGLFMQAIKPNRNLKKSGSVPKNKFDTVKAELAAGKIKSEPELEPAPSKTSDSVEPKATKSSDSKKSKAAGK